MDRHSPATKMTLVSTTSEPYDRKLYSSLQQYVDAIVSREVATAQAKLATHSTLTDEEAAVVREMAETIAADVVTERVRMAICGELDGRPTDPTDEQYEQIAALFDLSIEETNSDASTTSPE